MEALQGWPMVILIIGAFYSIWHIVAFCIQYYRCDVLVRTRTTVLCVVAAWLTVGALIESERIIRAFAWFVALPNPILVPIGIVIVIGLLFAAKKCDVSY